MLWSIYHHKSALWIVYTFSGLCCFLVEIIIYRYGIAIEKNVTNSIYELVISFSDLFALVGGVLLAYSLPKLSLSFTGSIYNWKWEFFIILSPIITFIIGLLFLINIGRPLSIWLLQGIIFSTIIISLSIIRLKSIGNKKTVIRKMIKKSTLIVCMVLPFIIIDALGFSLPVYLNDIPLIIFSCGISLITLFYIKELFGSPTYMEKNKITQYFIESYNISPRETDVIEQVLEGLSNNLIGEKLFISHKTVENHISSIFRKTKVKNKMELVHLIHSSSN